MGRKPGAAAAVVAVLALLAGCHRTVQSTVTSSCGSTTYTDSITSTIDPFNPTSGSVAVFEVDNNRQNSLVIERAVFRYPIPAQVHHVINVTFPSVTSTADARSWRVEAGQVVVEFYGNDNPYMVNDFETVRITTRLKSGLAKGTKIHWKPYSVFEHRYVSDPTLTCTTAPSLVLQSMTVS